MPMSETSGFETPPGQSPFMDRGSFYHQFPRPLTFSQRTPTRAFSSWGPLAHHRGATAICDRAWPLTSHPPPTHPHYTHLILLSLSPWIPAVPITKCREYLVPYGALWDKSHLSVWFPWEPHWDQQSMCMSGVLLCIEVPGFHDRAGLPYRVLGTVVTRSRQLLSQAHHHTRTQCNCWRILVLHSHLHCSLVAQPAQCSHRYPYCHSRRSDSMQS
jgi:hypothetical protein